MKNNSFTSIKILTFTISLASLIGLFNFSSFAKAASITNGGFEIGFLGWTSFLEGFPPIQNPPSGVPASSIRWFNTSGGISPLSNAEILAPFEGQKYAVSDWEESGAIVLYQNIFLEPDLQHTLSFSWFTQTTRQFQDSGSMSLSNNSQGPTQLFRVDLVPSDFINFFGVSTEEGILANVVPPIAEPFPASEWNTTIFDLTPWAGSTVRLAFRQTAIGANFNTGIDNVKVTSSSSIPESSSILTILILGIFGLTSILKRR